MNIFLTAYDPTDLPGGSIDPMGFEAGYLQLAEVWLPHLTNVASRPRYFSVLCAGITLAKVDESLPPRAQAAERQAAAQRLERLWILANVLAADEQTHLASELGGLRGITYAQARAQHIRDNNERTTDGEYKLLLRQTQYGLIGLYGAVADRLRFIERKSLTLTPDLGEVLGDAFIRETDLPAALKKAVRDNVTLPVDELSDWGSRAFVSGEIGPIEGKCLMEALQCNPQRARVTEFVREHTPSDDKEPELARLTRIRNSLGDDLDNRDIMHLIDFILAYESAYRLVMVVFERLLWLGRTLPGGAVPDSDILADAVLEQIRADLSPALESYFDRQSALRQHELKEPQSNLAVVSEFLGKLRESLDSNITLTVCVLDRHRDVQSGKFDRGRRKMPWIERDRNVLHLTLAPASDTKREITEPEQVAPHEYRLATVDWFLRADHEALAT